MIVTLEWLRDFVDIGLSVDELVHRLTMTGLEVDGVEERGAHLEKVITARVDSVGKHPNADRLHLCRVSDGRNSYQVVCGAPNVRENATIALALPGARLPGGITLKEAKVRGELSQGMICSQKELDLGDDASGIWILSDDATDDDIPLGAPLADALGIRDTVLDVSITPNRADCLSIMGIAREVAAICGSRIRYPAISVREDGPPIESLASVTLEDPIGCPRYAARLIQGVTIGPSPRWLRNRLEAVGLRSINNIVDVTNWILMEMGQPLHAFDFDRLKEHRIVVRRARTGERFTTLDSTERTLFDDTLMICDGAGPVAIAGIMGGLNSEIVQETNRVLIESAFFQPQSIRRTGRKLGLRTESCYRFERGTDPEGVIRAVDRAALMMQELAGGVIAKGRIDEYPNPIKPPVLNLRVERTAKFLGIPIGSAKMANALRSIEMEVDDSDPATLRVVPPPFRHDISREVDLAEEVARLAGYDSIPVTQPEVRIASAPENPHLRMREDTRRTLEGYGLCELVTYSFISRQLLAHLRLPQDDPRLHPIEVKNPISDEQDVMRTTLTVGILQTAAYNLDHKNEDLKLFELSKVFLPSDGAPLPEEKFHLAGVLAGRRYPDLLYGGDEQVDFADAKGLVEAVLALFHLTEPVRFNTEGMPPYMDPWRSASVFAGDEYVGTLGQIHPDVAKAFDLKKDLFVFELDFDRLFALRQPRPLFRSMPKFPAVGRDMAVIVNEDLPVQKPLDLIREQREPLLEEAEVFDLYRGTQFGEGKKSVGYRLVYRAPDRSLTDEEVNLVHNRLVDKVVSAFNAVLR